MSQDSVIYANGPGQDKCVFSRLLLEAFRWLRSHAPPGSWLKTVAYYWIFRRCDNNVHAELLPLWCCVLVRSRYVLYSLSYLLYICVILYVMLFILFIKYRSTTNSAINTKVALIVLFFLVKYWEEIK